MTPQQREQLNRFLATDVLGWNLTTDQQRYKRATNYPIYTDHWNPVESWADCEPLLDKIERDGWKWRLQWDGLEIVTHLVCLAHPDSAMVSDRSERLTEALCLAIARAYGFKEEA